MARRARGEKSAVMLRLLDGADRRSLRGVAAVVQLVLDDSGLFAALFRGMSDGDPVRAMRSADAVEKITAQRPELLRRYGNSVLRLAASARQKEVRWHLAQLLQRLELQGQKRRRAEKILLHYLADESSIVKTFAMQALATFAVADSAARKRLVPRLEQLAQTGTPAMRARGRRLMRYLSKTTRD